MPQLKWETSKKFKGVRWYKHSTRKKGVAFDRCFGIRYTHKGKRYESILGWESHGWNEKKADDKRDLYLANLKTGAPPFTYKQELAMEREANEAEIMAAREAAERIEAENISFGTVFDAYLEWAKTNKKHWADDERRYRLHLKPHLHDVAFAKVNSFMLEGIKAKLLKSMAPATVKHCLVIVRQVFNRAIDNSLGINDKPFNWSGKNPMSGVKLKGLVGDNSKQRTIDTFDSQSGEPGRDEKRLMAALKEKSFTTYGLAMTSLYAGLRFSEAANLKWMHVDLNSGHINLLDGKGGLDRKILIPIHPKLRAVFEAQRIKQNKPNRSTLVWPNRDGKAQGKISATFPRSVEELKLNEGIEERRMRLDFHSLRHSFATRLGNAGTPMTVLRDLMGHHSLEMVSRYAKSSQSVADEAVASLGHEIGPAKVIHLN